MIVFVFRLFLGGLISFLAILVWSKTRDVVWMLIALGMIMQYVGVISQIIGGLGISFGPPIMVGGMPLTAFILSIIPQLLTITALIWFLVREKIK